MTSELKYPQNLLCNIFVYMYDIIRSNLLCAMKFGNFGQQTLNLNFAQGPFRDPQPHHSRIFLKKVVIFT